jgi:3-phosphoshikimate 1-carboxyvinyltransferase
MLSPRTCEQRMPPPETLLQPLEALPDPLPIPVLAQQRGGPSAFIARVRPPGSKSLTNRALLLSALARGGSTLHNPLLGAEDTERMITAIEALGAQVDREGATLRIEGVGGRWPAAQPLHLHLANAGTAVRFLAAAALLARFPVVIDGDPRMHERPIAELGAALEQLGAEIEYLKTPGNPPLRITPPTELIPSARIHMGCTQSSQFISALLLIAPFLPGGLTLTLDEKITSRSYVRMTLGLLDAAGARVRTSEDLRIIRVSPAAAGSPAGPLDYHVEPDASSATYFWGAAAICPGSVARILGLDARTLQADGAFPEVLSRMGAVILREEGPEPWIGIRGPSLLEPVMADMSQMPDAALTLAAVACFARGRSVLRGLRTLRVKESDRIAGLQQELSKLGVRVEIAVLGDRDAITIEPPPGGIDCSRTCAPVELETCADHRMAMAMSLIGLKRPNTFIRDPACVAKTYPAYWRDLAQLY